MTDEEVFGMYLKLLKHTRWVQINPTSQQPEQLGQGTLSSAYSFTLQVASRFDNEELIGKEYEDRLIRAWIEGAPEARSKMMLYIVPVCKSVIHYNHLRDRSNNPIFSMGDAMAQAYTIMEKNLGKSFNVSQRLHPWLWMCVKNELIRIKEKNDSLVNITESLDSPVLESSSTNTRATKGDYLSDSDSVNEASFLDYQQEIIKKYVGIIFEKMPPNSVKILKAHVYDRRKFEDIGNEYGKAASTIQRQYIAATKIFKEKYKELKADFEKRGDEFPLECAKLPNFPYALEILQFSES